MGFNTNSNGNSDGKSSGCGKSRCSSPSKDESSGVEKKSDVGRTVTVVGGAGRMGRWISEFLSSRGFEVTINDKDVKKGKKISGELDVDFTQSLDVVEHSDIVVVSVPIPSTEDVIKEVGNKMKEGSLLLDITSLKEGPVRAMEKHVPESIEKIGAHPLFGPGENTLDGKRIVLVPISQCKYMQDVKNFLNDEGAHIEVMDAGEHDKKMAVVQGLSHMMLICFGKTLMDMGINRSILDFGTPTFSIMVKNLHTIMVQNPGLYASIQTENPYVPEVHKCFLDAFTALSERAEKKDVEGIVDVIKEVEKSF